MGKLLSSLRSSREHTKQTTRPSSTPAAQSSTPGQSIPAVQASTPDAQSSTHDVHILTSTFPSSTLLESSTSVEQSTLTHAFVDPKPCKAGDAQALPTTSSTVGYPGQRASDPKITTTLKSSVTHSGGSEAGNNLNTSNISAPTSVSAAGSTSSAPVTGGDPCLLHPSGSTLTTDDENVLKYFVMLRRTGPAATTVAKVCRRLYGGGQLSVKDFCTNNLGFTNTQYNKIFTRHERESFEDIDWEQLDITCVYKLLQRVCGLAPPSDAMWTNPEPHHVECLEHILFTIKGERNFLAHEAVVLTDEGLQTRSQKLESLLEKALEKASCITGEDYTQDINEMKATIDDIRKSKTKLFLQNYQRELQEFLHELVNKVTINSQTELRHTYQKLWESECVWWHYGQGFQSPQLEKIFTDTTVITKNNIVVPVMQILDYKLPDGSLPRLVVLEGIAGMGKSQICKYMLKCWASKVSTMNSCVKFDIIIFIQCHSVSSSSLSEFLREELLKDTCKGLRHEDVIRTLRECYILFIIDGIDEAGKHAKCLIKEVGAKFPESRVVVSCRPEYTGEAKRLISPSGNSFTVLYVKGFSKTQQKAYINKVLIVMEDNITKRKEMVQMFLNHLDAMEHEIYSLLSLPLTMMLLTLLWLQDNTTFTGVVTITHILQQSVEMSIKRLVHRTNQKSNEIRHVMLIERACRRWLLCLARVAWESLTLNTQSLDSNNYTWISDLLAEAEQHDIDPIDALSSFLVCRTPEDSLFMRHIWEFPHKAYQEYLSGLHLNEDGIKSQCSYSRSSYSRGDWQPYDEISSGYFRSVSRGKRTRAGGGCCLTTISIICAPLCCIISSCSSLSQKIPKPMGGQTSSAYIENTILWSINSDEEQRVPRTSAISSPPTGLSLRIKMRRSIDGSRDTRRSSEISREMQRSSDGSRDTRRSSEISREMRRSSDGSEEPYAFFEILDDTSFDTTTHNQALLFSMAIEVSKQNCNEEKIASILEQINKNSMFNTLVGWSNIIRECAGNEIVCRLIEPYLQKHRTIQLSGYEIYQTLPAIQYLMQTTGFIPESLAISLGEDDVFPDVFPSLVASLGTLSVYTNINCFLHHCLDLFYCLIKQETLDYVNITVHGNRFSELSGFARLLQYLRVQNSKLNLNLTVNDTQSAENIAQCFANTIVPRDTELLLFFTCFTPMMHHPLCQIFMAFPWQKPLSVAFSHTDLCSNAPHRLKLISRALMDAQVKITHASLEMDADAKSSAAMYKELVYILAGEASFDAAGKASLDNDGKGPPKNAGKVPLDAAGKVPLDAAGKIPLDAAGKVPLDAAGKVPLDAAGKIPLDAAGKIPLDAAGKVPLDAAGKVPLDAAGKVALDAAGKVPLDAAGKVALDAAGKVALDAAGKVPLNLNIHEGKCGDHVTFILQGTKCGLDQMK
nr:uncharacterized protein LOC123746910 [Procambarus clarkii]